MSDDGSPGFHTRSLHTGQSPDNATGARTPPLYQTTSYVSDDAADAATRFALGKPDHIYSRLMNPIAGMLWERPASLEGGVGVVVTSSRMAASDFAIFLFASADGNIASASSPYDGICTYLTRIVEHRGVATRFVDALNVDTYETTIDDNAVFIHPETIGNPALVTLDIEAVAEVVRDHGTLLFVDNTFAAPHLCSPIKHDADLVWESMTRWTHGASTTIDGILVDGDSFPWDEYTDDYPEIAKPNPVYHGVNFSETSGPAGFTYTVIARGLRDLGNAQSPFDAWQTLEKFEPLPFRIYAHCGNAQAVAEFLDNHEGASWVNYPSLDSHGTYEEASKYLDDDYGGMITLSLTDGHEAAKGTINNAKLALFLTNADDAKTFVIHPTSTTHQQLTDDEQVAAGVAPDTVRLSIGIEDVDDIVDDLDQAIRVASN